MNKQIVKKVAEYIINKGALFHLEIWLDHTEAERYYLCWYTGVDLKADVYICEATCYPLFNDWIPKRTVTSEAGRRLCPCQTVGLRRQEVLRRAKAVANEVQHRIDKTK